MNKPEKTYKQELVKWLRYLYKIEYGNSYKVRFDDIVEETIDKINDVTIIDIIINLPSGFSLYQCTELSNKSIENCKFDLIESTLNKLYIELFKSLIYGGSKFIENKKYGT